MTTILYVEDDEKLSFVTKDQLEKNNYIVDTFTNGFSALKGFKKKRDLINKEITYLKEKKEQSQPTRIKTSGSTFKNPVDQSDKKVWQLIKESVPLKKSFGEASISEKHCNFFVNKGNAKFEDMKKLINFVYESVLKKTGVKLETEIKILE